jgi:hypothetical protein
MGLATYHDTEREHIRGLPKASFAVGFRATPHVVPHLCTNNVGSRRNVGGIFQIAELDSSYNYLLRVILPVNKYIICLDIYNRQYGRQKGSTGEQIFPTCVNDILIM